MSQDQPSLLEILKVVREYLDEIKDVVPEKDRYHALCCSYLLAVAEREVASGTLAESRDVREREIAELATRLRAGRCDDDWDRTFSLVMQQVIDKVKVSKPDHLDPLHR